MGSRVGAVLAFLEATESLCQQTDLVADGCLKALVLIDQSLAGAAELLDAFVALDLCLEHAHKLAME